jgi:uncharacterized membrane protein
MQDGISDGSETKRPDEPQLGQFTAILLPHRSLSRKGFITLMIVSAAINSVLGVAFALGGAWPVAGFCATTVGLLYLAFRLNYRAARMSETIVLSTPELRLTRRHPTGRTESWSFNPYWVRFQHERRDYAADELSLASHGRKLVFGAFLSDIEKNSFAAALTAALARLKGHSSTHLREM